SKIPFTDSGFLYGDGLFETIRFNNNKPFRINKHITRLRNGCKVLYFKIELNESQIMDSLKWSKSRGNRSGRTAWQYIIETASNKGINIDY
ncbi:MAG: hypothetical protein CFH21_01071, partial [Alphaproteobacteria bacterium MarineAlpha5_Bin11]